MKPPVRYTKPPVRYTKPLVRYTKPLFTTALNLLRKHRFHLIAWACFILNEVLAARFIAGRFGPFANYVVHYGINISLFYGYANFLLPLAFRAKRPTIIRFLLAAVTGILLYLFTVYVADHLLSFYTNHQFTAKNLQITPYFLFTSVWRGVYFMGFSTGYYFINAYLLSKLAKDKADRQILLQLIREKESAIQLSRAKNAYLQAQISPHFLFNSFNFIYSKSRKSDPETAKAIILLTKLMRYSLETNHGGNEIKIVDEIAQVSNLIAFWEIRQGYKIAVEIKCSEQSAEAMFIPLVLLTLAENILIHGDLTPTANPASIEVYFSDEILEIRTANDAFPQQGTAGLQSGLKNIKERLEYSYGENALLVYGLNEDKKQFKVEIILNNYRMRFASREFEKSDQVNNHQMISVDLPGNPTNH